MTDKQIKAFHAENQVSLDNVTKKQVLLSPWNSQSKPADLLNEITAYCSANGFHRIRCDI